MSMRSHETFTSSSYFFVDCRPLWNTIWFDLPGTRGVPSLHWQLLGDRWGQIRHPSQRATHQKHCRTSSLKIQHVRNDSTFTCLGEILWLGISREKKNDDNIEWKCGIDVSNPKEKKPKVPQQNTAIINHLYNSIHIHCQVTHRTANRHHDWTHQHHERLKIVLIIHLWVKERVHCNLGDDCHILISALNCRTGRFSSTQYGE